MALDSAKQEMIKQIAIKVAPIIWEKAKLYFSQDHGSKVKSGAFADCPIEMFDNQAGIIVDEDTREIVMLTHENIQTYHFVKEKTRAAGKMHKYYYYDITFKNGLKSYVRMRKKYRNAMEASVKGNQIGDFLAGMLNGPEE